MIETEYTEENTRLIERVSDLPILKELDTKHLEGLVALSKVKEYGVQREET